MRDLNELKEINDVLNVYEASSFDSWLDYASQELEAYKKLKSFVPHLIKMLEALEEKADSKTLVEKYGEHIAFWMVSSADGQIEFARFLQSILRGEK